MSEDILQLALRLRDMYRQIDAESHPARVIDALAAEMVSFRTKNARLREALAFYASKDNYKMRREPSYRDRFSQNMRPGRLKLRRVSEDNGKRARAALKERNE